MTQDHQQARTRLLEALTDRVGKNRAVSMSTLVAAVFDQPSAAGVKGARQLRKLITELREAGHPICSVSTSSGGGYFLASAGSELDDYTADQTRRALKILRRVAKMRRESLPRVIARISANLKPEGAK